MSSIRSLAWGFSFSAALAWQVLALVPLAAAQTPPAEPPDSPGEPAVPKNADAAPADPLAIPEEADNEDLLTFIAKLQARRPEATTRDALVAEYLKMQRVIVDAADRVLASGPTPAQRRRALNAQFQAIGLMARLGEESLMQRLVEALPRVVSMLQDSQADRGDYALALSLARALEYSGQTSAAADAYRQFAELFAQSSIEAVAASAAKLQGVARRLNLPGNPIEIRGTLLDGTELDWSQYRGKVVLIDFWATWCGPCVREIPNVKRAYDKYHNRGLEVIGISLDDDAEKVEQFLTEQDIPWVTLFSADPEHTGWSHPMAEFYGVNAIPTVILVNRDGRVVDLNARGERLQSLLDELIGPADE